MFPACKTISEKSALLSQKISSNTPLIQKKMVSKKTYICTLISKSVQYDLYRTDFDNWCDISYIARIYRLESKYKFCMGHFFQVSFKWSVIFLCSLLIESGVYIR